MSLNSYISCFVLGKQQKCDAFLTTAVFYCVAETCYTHQYTHFCPAESFLLCSCALQVGTLCLFLQIFFFLLQLFLEFVRGTGQLPHCTSVFVSAAIIKPRSFVSAKIRRVSIVSCYPGHNCQPAGRAVHFGLMRASVHSQQEGVLCVIPPTKGFSLFLWQWEYCSSVTLLVPTAGSLHPARFIPSIVCDSCEIFPHIKMSQNELSVIFPELLGNGWLQPYFMVLTLLIHVIVTCHVICILTSSFC